MKKILIIEDSNDINNLICEALTNEGYECRQAFSGTEGRLYASSENFDLTIMDLMLPGLCGEELLPCIKEKQNIPVIVLSAKDALDSKISLLNAGADDYITKPFEISELTARVGVQLRKRSPADDRKTKKIRFKDLTLDSESFSAEVNGTAVSFTKQEFKIIELLLSNPKRVYSKQDIYEFAWDDYYIGEDKTINMHISNIRKKLRTVSDKEYIETVWGIGFKADSGKM